MSRGQKRARSGSGFRCPRCGASTMATVLDSRRMDHCVRRRRVCNECDHRITTYEVSEEVMSEIDLVRLALKSIRTAIESTESPRFKIHPPTD